jgi:predicted nucleic acid-binding protein
MATRTFVDTAAWRALIDRRDAKHGAAAAEMNRLIQRGTRLITSDYVVDEACTLIRARVGAHASVQFLDLLDKTVALALEWIGPDRFESARTLFRKHPDQGFSFTDCTSFVLMEELGITDVLTTDQHFRVKGFRPLRA